MNSFRYWLFAGFLSSVLALPLPHANAQTYTAYNWKLGPGAVSLAGQATLWLPEGYSYLEPRQTQMFLRDRGNIPTGREAGIVALHGAAVQDAAQGSGAYSNWFIIIYFISAGYVPDSTAANFDKNQMLAFFTQGTEADNAQRANQGLQPISVNGWAEEPFYDKVSHRMSWGLSTSDSVNYHLIKLGREGFFDLNIIGPLSSDTNVLTQLKAHVQFIFNQIRYLDGKGYSDFNRMTDPVGAISFTQISLSGTTTGGPSGVTNTP